MRQPTLIDHKVRQRARNILTMNSNKRRAIDIKARCQGGQAESQAPPIVKEARRASQKV
jgi:hypothetical protein